MDWPGAMSRRKWRFGHPWASSGTACLARSRRADSFPGGAWVQHFEPNRVQMTRKKSPLRHGSPDSWGNFPRSETAQAIPSLDVASPIYLVSSIPSPLPILPKIRDSPARIAEGQKARVHAISPSTSAFYRVRRPEQPVCPTPCNRAIPARISGSPKKIPNETAIPHSRRQEPNNAATFGKPINDLRIAKKFITASVF